MWESFLAFNQNAIYNFAYLVSTNFAILLMLIGVVGIMVMLLKEEVDTAVRDEPNII